MPKYRHYRLDGAGRISSADWLDADSDDDAIQKVRALGLVVPSELWRGNRRLARIEPGDPM